MSFELFVSALTQELPDTLASARKLGLAPADAWNVLVVAELRETLRGLARARGRDLAQLDAGRLFESVPGFETDTRDAARKTLFQRLNLRNLGRDPAFHERPLEAFGQLYEALLAAKPEPALHSLRKRSGSYYTPEALTRVVVERGFQALSEVDQHAVPWSRRLRVLDPALGAGAFLVQGGRETARRSGRPLADVVTNELFGVDISPLAVAVAEASLWLLADSAQVSLAQAGANLRVADALCSASAAPALGRRGIDFRELVGDDGFDLVLGNPPWVSFAGRATQPLGPALRGYYRRTFRGFSGYPTLHALFVELGARLAPRGVVALLIPSPLADLDGYRHVRAVLSASHAVHEPLLELGQDAFASVTQPCFALVASPRSTPATDPERPFVLTERRRAGAVAKQVQTPSALLRLAGLPRLPNELFGEMGLQTNGAVTRELLHRGSSPPQEYSYPLLEGRSITEFELSAPRAFLKPDRDRLGVLRCRLREASDYRRVKLVVRQTAAIPIAALHDGTPFRNSLLAGFELPEFPAALTLGLLNSTLYRALHLAGRRDARQGAFPQVKVAHLRALPAPPASPGSAEIGKLALLATEHGLSPALRRALDTAVYGLFGVAEAEQVEIARFVGELSPRAGLQVPLTATEPARAEQAEQS